MSNKFDFLSWNAIFDSFKENFLLSYDIGGGLYFTGYCSEHILLARYAKERSIKA